MSLTRILTSVALMGASAALTLGAYGAILGGHFTIVPQPLACTEEAMLCPDGSSVGRTGPDCHFAACPVVAEPVSPGAIASTSTKPVATTTKPQLCDADARQCPDGSSVGRTGADCHFAECPVVRPEVSGTLSGVVVLSPTCPVESTTVTGASGGAAAQSPGSDCVPAPYETTLTIIKGTDGGTAKQIKSDASGAFSTSLAPGDYTLITAGGEVYPRCDRTAVSIFEQETTSVQIVCDTGIR